MRRSRVLLLVSVISGSLGLTQAAHALDVEDITLSTSQRTVVKKYASVASTSAGATPHKPSDCKVATWCDVIDVKLEVPSGFTNDFGIQLTISWSLEANDYDIYLYDRPDATKEVDSSANFNVEAGPKEVVGLLNPAPGTYYLVVYNFSAVDAPYSLKGEFLEEEKLPDLPVYQRRRPPQQQQASPDAARQATPPLQSAGTSGLAPEVGTSPRPVESYGPDGAPIDENLQALETSNVDEPFSLNPLMLAVLIIVIIGASVAVFIFLTRRRQSES